MSDFFESETVTKRLDSKILKRILGYIKPYKILAVSVLLALVFATIGELLLPLITRQVFDKAILVSWRKFHQDSGVDSSVAQHRDAQWFFLAQSDIHGLSPAQENRLISDGLLDEDTWYLLTAHIQTKRAELLEQYGSSLVYHTNRSVTGVVSLKVLNSLDVSDRLELRKADQSYVYVSVFIYAITLVLVLVATFWQTWTTHKMGQSVMKDIRTQLYSHGMRQSLASLSRQPVGRIVNRISGDVETIQEFFTNVLSSFLKDFAIMTGVLLSLFLLSPALASVVVLTLPLVVVAAMISRVKARDAFRKQRTASSRLNAFLSEHISGVSTVQLFGREEASSKRFSIHNTELLDANLGEMHVFAVFRPLVDFFASLSVAVVLVVGAYFLSGQRVSIGVLIAFVHLVQMFYSPVQDIAEKFTLLQSAMAGAERVFDFLDTDVRIPDTPCRQISCPVRGDIEFKDVRFSYKKGEEILRGLTFSLKAGQMAAVVGPTGAGKSTIINLLTRMWDIESGSILLDGIPIRDISLDQLRSAVLPVQQDVFLFSMSVADTIRMGKDLSDEQVIEAAKSVRVHEFIEQLPEGYNTILSEGATNISTGQRQLISFARVVAHNPAVIVLDEASSSIDTETERLVQEGMDIILQGRSSIVIAHRLSTVMHADTILVLSDGQIAEQGTHSELMKLNKIYAELKKTQYAAQDALGFLD